MGKYLLLIFLLISGCGSFSSFLTDAGMAAQGLEVGNIGPDTTAEKVIDAVEIVQPALPPVFKYIVTAVLSGLAVYGSVNRKQIKPTTKFREEDIIK